MPEEKTSVKIMKTRLTMSGSDDEFTFVSVDRFEIHHVSNDVVLVYNSVATEHVSSDARDVKRLSARVALY